MAKTNAKKSSLKPLKQGNILDFFGTAKGSGVHKPKAPKPSYATKAAASPAISRALENAVAPENPSLDVDPSSAESSQSTLFSAAGESLIGSQSTDITAPYIGEEEEVAGPEAARAKWAALLNGVTKTSALLDGGFETIGQGPHQAIFRVKVLSQSSAHFFTGPIRQVDKSEESVARYRRNAAYYPVIRENTVVRCADGKPLIYFIKGGMNSGLSLEEQHSLSNQSITAIRDLTLAYPPPPPKQKDSRLQGEQQKIQSEKNALFGRYMLTYWHPDGGARKPPMLSSQSKPASKQAKEQVAHYMQSTQWEHVQVSKWISAIDPVIHQELSNCYQNLGSNKLEHLYQGPDACHSGLALLINRAEGPHKDHNDARDNWTSTNCWCVFEGGCVVYPDLGIKIAQEPGDLSLCRAAVLIHFVEDITQGERFCHVRFTKKDILRPLPGGYQQLKIQCPVEGCTRICPSLASLRYHLRGRKDEASRRVRSNKYHWIDLGEAKELEKKAMALAKEEEMADDSDMESVESVAGGADDEVMEG